MLPFCPATRSRSRLPPALHRAGSAFAGTNSSHLNTHLPLFRRKDLDSVSTRNQQWPALNAVTEISIAHSPDSDDAFMFYGLATNKVRVPGYRFSHTLCDIETLNRRAREEAFYDVTAISFHAYPYVQENYTLMGCGGSVGEGYGPMVVSTARLTPKISAASRSPFPARSPPPIWRSRSSIPTIETETVPFDQIIPEILAGKYRSRTHHPRRPAHLLLQRSL